MKFTISNGGSCCRWSCCNRTATATLQFSVRGSGIGIERAKLPPSCSGVRRPIPRSPEVWRHRPQAGDLQASGRFDGRRIGVGNEAGRGHLLFQRAFRYRPPMRRQRRSATVARHEGADCRRSGNLAAVAAAHARIVAFHVTTAPRSAAAAILFDAEQSGEAFELLLLDLENARHRRAGRWRWWKTPPARAYQIAADPHHGHRTRPRTTAPRSQPTRLDLVLLMPVSTVRAAGCDPAHPATRHARPRCHAAISSHRG